MDAQTLIQTNGSNLRLYSFDKLGSDQHQADPRPSRTPNEWFGKRYPDQLNQFGSPFLELTDDGNARFPQIYPVSINQDFFAGVLGGRKDFGHHVIYFEPELAWYFKDSDHIYKSTTAEKLMTLYRGLMMKCAQDLPANVHKLNLFHEWRGDQTCKLIVQRAKAILAADQSFFSASSPHQRIKGPELQERLIHNLVETMLERKEGACLTVTQAYEVFCRLSEQRSLGTLKRSMFKELMRDLIKDKFDLALRHDVPDRENKHQQAWKGLAVVEAEVLTA